MTPPNLNRLTEHVYWLAPDARTDRPVLGAIVGDRGALIVDAGNSIAHADLLLEGLAGLAVPRFVALTHWHWDHVFGSSAFHTPIIAHSETKAIVERMAQLDWSDEALDQRVAEGTEIAFCRDMMKAELPDRSQLRFKPPDISFEVGIKLDMGGVSCEIAHVGGDHSSDSSVVYVREDKVLFISDCLGEDLHHGPRQFTSRKLFPLLDALLAYEADHYLWGHDVQPMPRQEMLAYTNLLRSIGLQVERIGADRERIIRERQQVSGKPLDAEQLEIVDAFIAGLQPR